MTHTHSSIHIYCVCSNQLNRAKRIKKRSREKKLHMSCSEQYELNLGVYYVCIRVALILIVDILGSHISIEPSTLNVVLCLNCRNEICAYFWWHFLHNFHWRFLAKMRLTKFQNDSFILKKSSQAVIIYYINPWNSEYHLIWFYNKLP